MSALSIFQEFDKQKAALVNLSMPNKTSKTVIQKIEVELRQALLKNRGSPENSIMNHIHELAAKDDANERIGIP